MSRLALTIVAVAAALGAPASAQVAPDSPPDNAKAESPRGSGLLASYAPAAAQTARPPHEAAISSGGLRTLPEFRVTEIRTPVFRDHDLYTKAGMAYLSFRRHPGLLIGNFFRLNESVAYETFMEDDWNRTKAEYFDMAHAMSLGGDPAEGRVILDAIDGMDVRMRAESENAAAAPSIGRFQIASAETGTKLLELPAETIDIPFIKKTW
jgi:hypothetical protein